MPSILRIAKASIAGIVLAIVVFLAFYVADVLIFVPNFFETGEEIAWARDLNSRTIDFYAQPWIHNQTQPATTTKCGETIEEYISPSQRYRFIYKRREEGFYIVDAKTDLTVLNSAHWVVHPSEVKWFFDDRYILYMHSEDDMIGLQRHYIYVGNLRTGRVARVTTAITSDGPR